MRLFGRQGCQRRPRRREMRVSKFRRRAAFPARGQTRQRATRCLNVVNRSLDSTTLDLRRAVRRCKNRKSWPGRPPMRSAPVRHFGPPFVWHHMGGPTASAWPPSGRTGGARRALPAARPARVKNSQRACVRVGTDSGFPWSLDAPDDPWSLDALDAPMSL
jgi:hypothetical protein